MNTIMFNSVASELKAVIHGVNEEGDSVPLVIDQDGNMSITMNATNPDNTPTSLKVSEEGNLLVEFASELKVSSQPVFLNAKVTDAIVGEGTVTLLENTDISQVKNVSVFIYNTSSESGGTITYTIYISPVDSQEYYVEDEFFNVNVEVDYGTSTVLSVSNVAHYLEIKAQGSNAEAKTTIYINGIG